MHFPSFPAWLLLALPLLPQQSPAQDPGDPRAELRVLKRDLNQALTAWREDARKKMEAAAQRGGVMPAFSMQPPTGKFITSAQRPGTRWSRTRRQYQGDLAGTGPCGQPQPPVGSPQISG